MARHGSVQTKMPRSPLGIELAGCELYPTSMFMYNTWCKRPPTYDKAGSVRSPAQNVNPKDFVNHLRLPVLHPTQRRTTSEDTA